MVCDKNGSDCVFKVFGKEMMPECCRAHLIETVHYTTWLLGLYGIKHWAEFGTLLGAVREEGHIPWDSDGDFGILMKDRATILGLRKKIKRDGFYLHESSPYVLQIVYSRWNWSYVELWCNERTTANKYKPGRVTETMPEEFDALDYRRIKSRMPVYKGGGPGANNDHTSMFPCWFVDETTTVTYAGKPIPAPRCPENFLDMRYGNWHDPVRKYDNYFGGNAWSLRTAMDFVRRKSN